MRVGFANGVFIVAPVDAMGDHETVILEDQGDGRTSVIITGEVTTTTTYSPPGGRRRSRATETESVPQGTQEPDDPTEVELA